MNPIAIVLNFPEHEHVTESYAEQAEQRRKQRRWQQPAPLLRTCRECLTSGRL